MPNHRRLVVGLLSDQQEFQRMQADDAARVAERTGFDVQVLYAQDNAIHQIQQLYKVIHGPHEERPFAILVETVVGEGLERVARASVAAGIGWVLLNRSAAYIANLRAEHPELPISVVSTDQEEVGRIQARQFRALVPSDEGMVLYIQGPSDTFAASGRLKGARQGLAGSRIDLRVLDGMWTEASGEHALTAWLRLKSSEAMVTDVIACQNDAMAVGALRAVTKSGRPELARIPVTGCDGLPEGGQRLVKMKQLAATVVVPSNTGPSMEMLSRGLSSRQRVPPELLLKPTSFPPESEGGSRIGPRRPATS